ncbi:hypothetical protein TWF751_001823 [Orbilia oligospora]|nr:hypothetical protein TWF751_001823 [Orbilia oligospora]
MPRAKKSSGNKLVVSEVPTGRTDNAVIITLSKEELQKYINREKTHFFRVNPWNQNVTKVWLYIKDPVKCITHVAMVGPLKAKGELGPLGKSNVAFNSGILNNGRHKLKAAYELTSILKLSRDMEFMHIIENRYSKPTANGNVYADKLIITKGEGELVAEHVPPHDHFRFGPFEISLSPKLQFTFVLVARAVFPIHSPVCYYGTRTNQSPDM